MAGFFGRIPDVPAAGTPAPGGTSPAAGGKAGRLLKDPKVLGVLGAGAVVLVALVAGRKADAGGSASGYEIDTRDTDLYGDLQPELENISDQLADLNDRGGRRRPRPRRPRPADHDGQHHPHNHSPRPDEHQHRPAADKPAPHQTPPTKPERPRRRLAALGVPVKATAASGK